MMFVVVQVGLARLKKSSTSLWGFMHGCGCAANPPTLDLILHLLDTASTRCKPRFADAKREMRNI